MTRNEYLAHARSVLEIQSQMLGSMNQVLRDLIAQGKEVDDMTVFINTVNLRDLAADVRQVIEDMDLIRDDLPEDK